MDNPVKRGPKAIRLQEGVWAPNFYAVVGDRRLCTNGVRTVFNLPDNLSNVWIVPFKRNGKDRANITIEKRGSVSSFGGRLELVIHIDGHDYGIDFGWVRTARRWIKQGYSYVGIEYED